MQLRDSLVDLLWQSSNGPKAVMIQLCLAIADLAIQLLQWKTVIADLVDKFGKTPHGSICLLEILKILPEEMNNNTRLPLTVSKETSVERDGKRADMALSLSHTHRITSTSQEERN